MGKYLGTYVNGVLVDESIPMQYYIGNAVVTEIDYITAKETGNYIEKRDLINRVCKLTYSEKKYLDKLRQKRKPLLEAFDRWEKAVLRGREADSSSVMNWYTSLLNLEESAFENIPIAVQYYVY